MTKTKRCFKCGKRKLRSEFYRHVAMGDGLLGKCKDCTKADSLAAYHRKRQDPAWLEAQRARGREKFMRLYRNPSPMPFWVADVAAEAKKAATQMLGNAVRDGKVVRPRSCSKCGKACVPHGHHEDYGKPLDVEWLCPECHRARHAEMSPMRQKHGKNSTMEHRPRES